jgi:hypothetical protein
LPVTRDRPLRWRIALLGLGCLVVLALRAGAWDLPPLLIQLTPIHIQALLLIAGITLLTTGIGGLRWQDLARLRRFAGLHRREITLVLAIMALALALRLYHLDSVRALVDEGPFVTALMTMRRDPTVALAGLMDSIASSTRLFPWTQWVLSELFGSTLAVFRLAAVLYGVLTVGATYLLARLVFDRRTAYIAGLLLATFPPHIHMSRIAIYNIAELI